MKIQINILKKIRSFLKLNNLIVYMVFIILFNNNIGANPYDEYDTSIITCKKIIIIKLFRNHNVEYYLRSKTSWIRIFKNPKKSQKYSFTKKEKDFIIQQLIRCKDL